MSYFSNNIIYIIIPTASITNEMENNQKASFNSNDLTRRKSIVSLSYPVEKQIFKIKAPISAVFNGYYWYNLEEILQILTTPEWAEDAQ